MIPVIDVLSRQIFSTDPLGGLSVPILAGEPRVFLPLGCDADSTGVEVGSWYADPLTVRTAHGQGQQHQRGDSGTEPGSPSRRSRRSIGSLIGWLGVGGKHGDL